MFTVNPSSLVKGGKLTNHPSRFLFKAYLDGRKPSLILAFDFLAGDGGLLTALQAELAPKPQPRRFPTMQPVHPQYREMCKERGYTQQNLFPVETQQRPATFARLPELANILKGDPK